MPPENKIWNDGYGSYVWPPTGETFVSVTAFLSVINKPPLMRWAAKMAAEFAVKHRGEWEGLEWQEAVKQIKEAPFDSNARKSNVGTKVHNCVEQWALDRPFDIDDETRPYWRNFENFLANEKPEFEASEFTVYNRTHRYAGTGDILARIGGVLWLLDIKTGKWAYAEAALQLSAYAHGEFIGIENQFEVELPTIEKAGVLLLRPRSYKLLPLLCDPFDEELFEGFLAARDLWHWQQQQGEKVFPPNPVAQYRKVPS